MAVTIHLSCLGKYMFWIFGSKEQNRIIGHERVSEMSWFKFLPGEPAILTCFVFRRFPQTVHTNSGTLIKMRPLPLPFTSFPIHYTPIILSIDAMYSELLKVRLNTRKSPTQKPVMEYFSLKVSFLVFHILQFFLKRMT
jgi:hypothetical protein